MIPGLALENEWLRLRVAPGLGASVLSLELRRGEAWLPLWRPSPASPVRPNECASYLLAPYSNRIRDGRFSFEGRIHQLSRKSDHALHGGAAWRPWEVLETSPARARLRLDTRRIPDFDFPFPFVADVSYALAGAAFETTLALTSTGRERMPAGIGFHPYFARALDGGTSEVELEAHLLSLYPGEPPVPMLPTGPPRPVPPELDFSRSRPVDAVLDDCFASWDGRARFTWTRSGVAAELRATSKCRHVVIYSPAGKPFFAFEPVTNANDGFNLRERGGCDDGVAVLAPGETLEAGMTLSVADRTAQ
jgi:aldose 1-epimerase